MQVVWRCLTSLCRPKFCAEPLFLRKSIRFEDVYFRYGSELPEVLRGVILKSAAAIGWGDR